MLIDEIEEDVSSSNKLVSIDVYGRKEALILCGKLVAGAS